MSNDFKIICCRKLSESEREQILLLVHIKTSIIGLSIETAKNEDQRQAYMNVVNFIHEYMCEEYDVKIERLGDSEDEVQEFRPS